MDPTNQISTWSPGGTSGTQMFYLLSPPPLSSSSLFFKLFMTPLALSLFRNYPPVSLMSLSLFYLYAPHLTQSKKVNGGSDEGSRVASDLMAHNYVLTTHCFRGDLCSAVLPMEEIEPEGLGADTRIYNALMLGACRTGRVGVAVGLLRRRMEEEGVSPLYSMHMHMIKSMMRQAAELVRAYRALSLASTTSSSPASPTTFSPTSARALPYLFLLSLAKGKRPTICYC